jgi:long-chain acyl-CoA synthetase
MHKTFQFLEEFRGKIFKGEVPTLPELFLISEARFPEKRCFTAYSPEEMILTYSQAREKIFILAKKLLDEGLKKGQGVILTGKNSPEWTVSYLAVLAAGGVVVPLDYMLTDPETENLVNFTDAEIIIVDEEKYDTIGNSSGKRSRSISLAKGMEIIYSMFRARTP